MIVKIRRGQPNRDSIEMPGKSATDTDKVNFGQAFLASARNRLARQYGTLTGGKFAQTGKISSYRKMR